jgi:hypothetical protein
MKFNTKTVIFFLTIGLILAAAVSFSGCLSDDSSHPDEHFEGDGHDHDHGDPNASYEELDNASMNQVLNGSKLLVAVSVVPQANLQKKSAVTKLLSSP